MLRICLLIALAVGSALAQDPARGRLVPATLVEAETSYWPLAVGNTWTYNETTPRLFGSGPLEIRVVGEETHDRRRYFRVVEMFGREALLRMTSSGQLVEWLPEQGLEQTWYEFNLPVGGSWQPRNGDECSGRAEIASRKASVEVPAGTYSDALAVGYGPSPCADAGVSEEAFARGVGLLRRSIITIAGPRTFELREAEIGGKLLRGPALAFGLAIDRTTYSPNLMPPVDPARAVPTLEALIVVENKTSQPLTLRFNSGQQFDLEIRNAAGEVVYRWSDGKAFTEALTSIELSPGRKTFSVSAPLGDREGIAPLAAGRYLVEGWLTTSNGKAYSATVPIEITEAVF
jgi:hypothetical protein